MPNMAFWYQLDYTATNLSCLLPTMYVGAQSLLREISLSHTIVADRIAINTDLLQKQNGVTVLGGLASASRSKIELERMLMSCEAH